MESCWVALPAGAGGEGAVQPPRGWDPPARFGQATTPLARVYPASSETKT